MSAQHLPGPHVRLVFAVMLHRNGLLTDMELRAEGVAAFGPDAGGLIVDHLLTSPPLATSVSRRPRHADPSR